MKDAIQDLLHVTVEEKKLPFLNQLPLFLKNGYEMRFFLLGDIEVLFIKPKEPITVTALSKHCKRFEKITGVPCAIYGDEYTRYRRERLIELAIPFYFGKDNLYLPFWGIALKKKKVVHLPDIEKFSPITQKMLLIALYENWQMISTRQISEKMQISRATAARCLTELQALDLPVVEKNGKTKYYKYEGDKENLFRISNRYFNNPIIKNYALAELPKGLSCYGGLSALAEYSMLADNDYPTFAVTREEYRNLGLERYMIQPKTERPVCLVQVLHYKIEKNGIIDPISAILCIPEEEKEEPRIESTIKGMLEDIFNDKGIGYI